LVVGGGREEKGKEEGMGKEMSHFYFFLPHFLQIWEDTRLVGSGGKTNFFPSLFNQPYNGKYFFFPFPPIFST
jgi:hypothetical protein